MRRKGRTSIGEVIEETDANDECCDEEEELAVVRRANAIPHPWAVTKDHVSAPSP